MQDSRTFFHLTLRVGALHCWPSHYGHIEWTLAVRTFAVPDQSQTSLRAHLRPRGLMNTVLTTKKSRPGDMAAEYAAKTFRLAHRSLKDVSAECSVPCPPGCG